MRRKQYCPNGGVLTSPEGAAEKQNGRGAEALRPNSLNCEVELEGLDVRGLQALGALGHFEFNRLAIVQRLVAISQDGGEVHENIFTALALDESKALARVEPLHCSLFFTHCFYSFLLTALRSILSPAGLGPHSFFN